MSSAIAARYSCARDQRLDHLGERGRAGEPLAVVPPERRCRSSSGVASRPRGQRAGDVLGRLGPLAADDARQVGDGRRGELVPPLGEIAASRAVSRSRVASSSGDGGRGRGLRVQVELPADRWMSSSARGSRTVSSRPGKIGNSPW